MTITLFFAIFTVGCDILLVALFHFLFGEKRYNRSVRRLARHAQAVPVYSKGTTDPDSERLLSTLNRKSVNVRTSRSSAESCPDAQLRRIERLAHQRIAASLTRRPL